MNRLKKNILNFLPKATIKRIVDHNGVKVLIEKKINIYSAVKKGKRSIEDNPVKQGGLILAHKKFTKEGDTVVIVGGGNGITTVIASKIAGATGKVIVYEGGTKRVNKIKQTLDLNKITNFTQINHAIVGSEIAVFGKTSNAVIIPAESLPQCDVLELDCEGAEIGILRNMIIKPRVILVEIHPWLFSESPDWVTDYLGRLAYEIVLRIGHDGIELNQQDFKELLYRSSSHLREDRLKKSKYIESGARWPVIVVGYKA